MYTFELNIDYSKRLVELSNKKILILDTSTWLKLSRESDQHFKKIKEKLVDLVDHGKLLCPLSGIEFMEFSKQNRNSLLKLSKFIDRVSKGFMLLPRVRIIDKIVSNHFNVLLDKNYKLDHNYVVPFMCSFEDKFMFNFPYSFKDIRTKKYFTLLNNALIYKTFESYVENLRDDMLLKPEILNGDFKKALLEDFKFSNFNKKKVYEDNRKVVIHRVLLPVILKLYDELNVFNKLSFLSQLNTNYSLEDNLLKVCVSIFDNEKLLHNMATIMTIVGYDFNRNFKVNDYYDFEIMIIASSYSDLFFSDDKWMIDTLEKNKKDLDSDTLFFRNKVNLLELLNGI